MRASFVGHGVGTNAITPSSSRGKYTSKPFLATVPAKSASSLSASLRDILEQNDDKAAATTPSPPIPVVASSSAAAPLSTTIDGRTITTTTTASSLSTLDSENPYTDPIITISDSYDSGNGEFVSLHLVDGHEEEDVRVHVKIKPDPFTTLENKRHFQYFSFRSTLNPNSPAASILLSGGEKKSVKVKYVLENAGEASYADAFEGYSTFVTTNVTPFDSDSWGRVEDAKYEGGRLSWTHVHALEEDGGASSAYFAYFPPYSQDMHLGLVAKCAEAKGATVESLGPTIDGREIDFVTVGTGPRTCWIIHRQHPGESMAEFYAEGLLNRLLGLDGTWDAVAEKARELYTFRIVPNINPDGSSRGYLRTNAAGQNLNREWCPSPAPSTNNNIDDDDDDGGDNATYDAPTLERSPEVYHLLRHMDRTGCDAFLDVHGDEELPFNFLAGSQGMSVWGKRLESLHGAFLASYERANADVQGKVSYEPDEAGEGMPNICSNQIAERFDCFSGTLEMPFKECWADTTAAAVDVDGKVGWGPERARQLGASVLDALCYVAPLLRDEGEFWKDLPEDDAYVHPSTKY